MILRPLAVALSALLLSACATFPDISQSRSPCQFDPGGWCPFMREAAVEAWPFVVAATNAYTGDSDLFRDDGPQLEQLTRLPIAEEDADKGFGYELFARFTPGSAGETGRQPIARIVAFRGTDVAFTSGLTDIVYGTIQSDQFPIALRYFDAERARFDDGVPWIVTGHSMGGALATEVSVRYPEVQAYLFNTSLFGVQDESVNDVQRTVFNERGEVMRRFERYDLAPAANVYTINCRPQKNNFAKHKIRPLADCITWIAAYASDDALAVVNANGVSKPMVECGPDDKPHPGRLTRSAVPCVHVSVRAKK